MKSNLNFWKKQRFMRYMLGTGLALFLLYFIFCLPNKLFDKAHSTILEDSNSRLLSATIAEDGQWRFPESDSIPPKFEKALLAFEDRNFHSHFGVYFPSIYRAFLQNIKAGKIVSGGSTITMQIARMSRDKGRNIYEKIVEVIWAFRMETKFSKTELLNIYASNAPFGGNVVGLEAAAWRYFGQKPNRLTWAQAATLAVLPNAPSFIYPGKNQKRLVEKRNRVLAYLLEMGDIDSSTYKLSLAEEIPQKPHALPMLTPHLLSYAIGQGRKGERIQSSIDYHLQKQFLKLSADYQKKLNSNYIHNLALLIIDVHSNKVLTYIGNTAKEDKFSPYVDLIQAPRSTGSILKPLLFASMLMEGELHNEILLPDIPMHFRNFAPKNYIDQYDGAVRAKHALSRSLNVPSVYLLQQHGIPKFLNTLQKSGQKYLNKSAEHYGLSLILGGGESSLWDICKVYTGMARCLNSYKDSKLGYFHSDWEKPSILNTDNSPERTETTRPFLFDRASIYLSFEALLELNRPGAESAWKHFSSSKKIAWKTGTSFGNRDAWAIGCTPDYVVAVWAGNASGEGRPGLIGAHIAAPLMLDVFSRLASKNDWFEAPRSELIEMTVCAESGFRNGPDCTKIDTISTHYMAERTASCTYHSHILTDAEERYRYYIDCSAGADLQEKSYFVLPALQEWYYKARHQNYKTLPPFHPNCAVDNEAEIMEIIYPKANAEIVLVRDFDNEKKAMVFELAHREKGRRVFWHVDDKYIGSTDIIHKIRCRAEAGTHILKVIDEKGNSKSLRFSILDAN